MAKAIVQVASRVYQPGERVVNLPDLTSDDNGVQIVFTRENWPDTGADVISGIISGSNDGTNWFELTRFNYAGGNMINPRTKQPVLTCGPSVHWPEVYDQNGNATPERPAQVRADITNTAALRTAITLQGV